MMTDGTGVTEYSYADSGSLLSVETTYTGLSAKTIEYTYNPDGSRNTMVTPAGTFEYTYDNLGRLTQLTAPNDVEANWSYYDNNWVKKLEYGNGAYTEYEYNERAQLTKLDNYSSSGLISSFETQYDTQGMPTRMDVYCPAEPALSGYTTYTFDDRKNLTRETSTRNGGYDFQYTYDNNGNPTSARGYSYTYDANNCITNQGYQYDGNNSPTQYNGYSISYDKANRMTQVGNKFNTKYKGNGLRSWLWEDEDGWHNYYYDGDVPVFETDENGGIGAILYYANGKLIGRYEYNNTGLELRYNQYDPLGFTTSETDENGDLLDSFMTDSMGGWVNWPWYPLYPEPAPVIIPGIEIPDSDLDWWLGGSGGSSAYDPSTGRTIGRSGSNNSSAGGGAQASGGGASASTSKLSGDSATPILVEYNCDGSNPYSYCLSDPKLKVQISFSEFGMGYGCCCGANRKCGDKKGENKPYPYNCIDNACYEHDKCLSGVNPYIPFKRLYCDRMLCEMATYCQINGHPSYDYEGIYAAGLVKSWFCNGPGTIDFKVWPWLPRGIF